MKTSEKFKEITEEKRKVKHYPKKEREKAAYQERRQSTRREAMRVHPPGEVRHGNLTKT